MLCAGRSIEDTKNFYTNAKHKYILQKNSVQLSQIKYKHKFDFSCLTQLYKDT